MIRQILALSVLLMTASPAFAHDHCDCSKKCMTQCQKGGKKNCKCKSCDCSKSGKCDEGSCKKDDGAKAPSGT